MSRRWPALVLVPALLVAAVLLDDDEGAGDRRTVASAIAADDDGVGPIPLGAVDPVTAMPVTGGADALGSVWYCAGGTGYGTGVDPREAEGAGSDEADENDGEADDEDDSAEADEDTGADGDGEGTDEGEASEPDADALLDEELAEPEPVEPLVADHTVVVANDTERSVETSLTVFTTEDDGEPVTEPLTVGARSRERIRLGDLIEGPYVAALVEAPGSGVAVEHEVAGPHGFDAAPCSSSASNRWFFAAGATTSDARLVLTVLNPFPDTANVDVTYTAEDGVRSPAASQGVIVPGRSVVAIDVDAQVTIREQVSAVVTARSGRVVVDRLQSFDGSGPGGADSGPEGLTVGLGAPRAAPVWHFADGNTLPGNAERFVIFNPTALEASVEVALAVAEGEEPVEPFELSVRPGRYTVVDLSAEERVPDDIAFATMVRSLDGVPVVVERVAVRVEPSTRQGVATTLGSPLLAGTWIFPAGAATDEVDQWIALFNPNDEAVTVSVSALVDGELVPAVDGEDLTLAPFRHFVVQLPPDGDSDDGDSDGGDSDGGDSDGGDSAEDGATTEGAAVVVQASGPIVAEQGLYLVDEVGASAHQGIPQLDTAVAPDPPG